MRDLQGFVDDLADSGRVTAAGACILQGSDQVETAFGGSPKTAGGGSVGAFTFFDLASITKPLSATLALVLDQSGVLPLTTQVGEVWLDAAPDLAPVTLEDLLRHRARMRRWMPLYATCRSPSEVVEQLVAGVWQDGAAESYSDLDIMLWALTTERALDSQFTTLLEEHVLAALGREAFGVRSPVADAAECALPTGREVDLAAEAGLTIAEMPPPAVGEPQDGNTRFLGRVCGHAGVFSTLTGMAALAGAWVRETGLVSPASRTRALGGGGRYALGWFRSKETAGGRCLGERAFGHEGFVGGSVWIDPDRDLTAILLAHRASLNIDMAPVRVAFHRLATSL